MYIVHIIISIIAQNIKENNINGISVMYTKHTNNDNTTKSMF